MERVGGLDGGEMDGWEDVLEFTNGLGVRRGIFH